MSKNNNPFTKEDTTRHSLRGLWVTLIVFFCVAILPIGLVIALFYDSHHVETGITEKQEMSAVFNTVITDMFDNCSNEEDPSMDLVITQKQLNQLLYNSMSNIGGSASEYLKQFSVEITKDSYVFDLEVSAFNFAKTHLILQTTIKDRADLGAKGKGFVFQIDDIKLGRLGGLRGMLPWISNTLGLDLGSLFSSVGLHINSDIENFRLTYAYTDFINDVTGMIGSADQMFVDLFSNFITKEYITFSHNAGQNVDGKISLSRFKTNPDYCNQNYVISPKIDVGGVQTPLLKAKANDIVRMLNAGLISTGGTGPSSIEGRVNAMHQFLTYGYDFLDSTEKAYIESVYPSIQNAFCEGKSISEYSSYMRTIVFGGDPAPSLKDVLFEKINNKVNSIDYTNPMTLLSIINEIQSEGKYFLFDKDTPEEENLLVTDANLHDMFKDNTALVGYGYSFVNQVSANNYKVSYTMLDNVYTTIKGPSETDAGTLTLVFGLNINGCETSLVLPMSVQEITGTKKSGLRFSVEDSIMYYGTENFNTVKDIISNLINGITLDSDLLKIQDGSLELVIDAQSYIEANPTSEFAKFDTLVSPYADLVIKIGMETLTSAANNNTGRIGIELGYVKK